MTFPTKRPLVLLALILCASTCVKGQSAVYRMAARSSMSPLAISSRNNDGENAATSRAQAFANLARFSTDEHPNFPFLSLYHESKTPFIRESRVSVAPLFGSRLQLGIFITSIDNRNLMQGPFAPAGLPHMSGQVRSGDLYGIGVSLPLGHESNFGGSETLLHGLSRILHGS